MANQYASNAGVRFSAGSARWKCHTVPMAFLIEYAIFGAADMRLTSRLAD